MVDEAAAASSAVRRRRRHPESSRSMHRRIEGTMTAVLEKAMLFLLLVSALLLSTTPATAYLVRRRRGLLQDQAHPLTKEQDSLRLDSIVSSLPPEASQALSGYLSNAELAARLREVSERRCSHLGARVYEIGRSVRGLPLVVMSIGHHDVDEGGGEEDRGGAAAAALVAEKERETEKVESSLGNNARGLRRDFISDTEKSPSSSSSSSSARSRRSRRHRAHVKYVAGLHGDEPSGRQLLVALAEYICAFDPKLAAAELAAARTRRSGGGAAAAAAAAATTSPPQQGRHADPRVAALLSRTVLHLAPAVNPDGFDLRRRENAAGVDLNRDFPDPLELRRGVPVGRLFGNESSSSSSASFSAAAAGASSSSSSSSSSAFVGSLPGRSPDPDADDVDLSPRGKEQPETLALMRWMTPDKAAESEGAGENPRLARRQRTSFRFVASAALHEGALVANYPWDGTPDGSTRYAACPDDATFRWLASSYADRSPAMAAGPEFGRGVARPTDDGLVVPRDDDGGGGGNGGNEVSSSSVSASSTSSSTTTTTTATTTATAAAVNTVPDAGTTNGAAWYPLRGGMQDWNYLQASCFELTLELAQSKWPAPALLPRMFAENLDPLLAYPVVASAGAHGVVLSGDGRKGGGKSGGGGGDGGGGGEQASTTSPPAAAPLPPPPGTTVRVRGLRGAPPALPDPVTGAWFRPLIPGNYVISIAALGTQPVEAEIEVLGGSGRRGERGGSSKSEQPPSSGAKLALDRSPDLEVTLREQGSTARLVEVSGVVSVVAAASGAAAAVAVPLAKTTTKASAAATTAASSLLGGRKAGLASSSSSSLSGDAAAFFLQVALAAGAVAALIAVARRAAAAGRRGGGGAAAVAAGASS